MVLASILFSSDTQALDVHMSAPGHRPVEHLQSALPSLIMAQP